MNLRSARNEDRDLVIKLIFEILNEYGLKTDPRKTDNDLADIESNYINRNGIFDLLENEKGEVIATVGLYNIDSTICELRKMYLLKSERGKGYGKLLLNHALKRAKELGVSLEITARKGHSLTNGHVAKLALKHGTKLVIDTDSHAPGDYFTPELRESVLLGSGLEKKDIISVEDNMKTLSDLLLKKQYKK